MAAGVPDLLSLARLTAGGAELRRRLEAAGAEVSSGETADPAAAAGGDLRRLYALAAERGRLEAAAEALGLAGGRAAAMQAGLATLAQSGGAAGLALLAATGRADLAAARGEADAARDAFRAAVGALNGAFAGQSLFAGAGTLGPALAPADTILAGVAAAVAGAPDAATALAAIDAYFDDPGGPFRTADLLLPATDAPPADLGDGSRLAYAPRADAPAAVALLKALATVVMARETPPGASPAHETAMYRAAGTAGLAAAEAVRGLAADLGRAEATLAAAAARTGARAAALELAETTLRAADPYAAAARLRALETQLASHYEVTARLSALSLVAALR
jgi:flagellar hook-associated protein 3 FlgL